jgi:hypothetical protein
MEQSATTGGSTGQNKRPNRRLVAQGGENESSQTTPTGPVACEFVFID